MEIENFVILFAYLLAISSASERFVTLIRTIIPWLSEEAVSLTTPVNASQLRWKSFAVQCLTIVSAFATAFIVTKQGLLKNGIWNDLESKSWVIGLLACAGSAFWSGMLGYTTALKEIKKVELAEKKVKLAKMVSNFETKSTIFHEQ